jgi:hypothetical protein
MGRSSQRALISLNASAGASSAASRRVGAGWPSVRCRRARRRRHCENQVQADRDVHRVLDEEERIVVWRAEELERAGFRPAIAKALAAHKDVDLHLALDLVKNGCPHDTAIRIIL